MEVSMKHVSTQHVLSLLAVMSALMVGTAHAAPADRAGAYVYGGIGKASADLTRSAASAEDGRRHSARGSGSFYTVGTGYRLAPNFAVESSLQSTVGSGRGGTQGTLAHRSVDVGGLVVLPVGNRVEAFGKLAVGTRLQRYSAPTASEAGSTRERAFSLTPGVGVNLHLTDSLALRSDYTFAGKMSNRVANGAGADKARLTTWTTSLAYTF